MIDEEISFKKLKMLLFYLNMFKDHYEAIGLRLPDELNNAIQDANAYIAVNSEGC